MGHVTDELSLLHKVANLACPSSPTPWQILISPELVELKGQLNPL